MPDDVFNELTVADLREMFLVMRQTETKLEKLKAENIMLEKKVATISKMSSNWQSKHDKLMRRQKSS